jgi:hypothetical protein
VLIEKRKWDGSVSARWEADLRREDDRVVWVTPPGTRRERPRNGDVETTRCLEASASAGEGWIVTAVIDEAGRAVRYEVDATVGDETPREGVFAFVDLDLDMEIGDGDVTVEDLDDFVRRLRTMGYPPGLLTHATAALGRALARYGRGDWPFDGSLLAPRGDSDGGRRPRGKPG